jgi:hypothetical protein
MMCGGSGAKEGGKGAEGDDFSTMQIVTSHDHGGRRHPTAAIGTSSRLLSIQQSTNILIKRKALLKLEKIIVITIFMTILGTMCRQIVVPNRCRSRWSYHQCRASAATALANIRGI